MRSCASWTGRIFSIALKFKNNLVFKHQVDLVAAIELESFVGYRQIDLPLEAQSS
ncbi:MAG TPA: hypothetical protein VMQ17_02505 [Candidatus Sulfotelmatobacter sp.]|nr:hypothetical protein [Candidatus Sulfotelmatobacter sp.]